MMLSNNSSMDSHLPIHYAYNVTGRRSKPRIGLVLKLRALLKDPNIKSHQKYFPYLCKQFKLLLVEAPLSLNHQTSCITQQQHRHKTSM